MHICHLYLYQVTCNIVEKSNVKSAIGPGLPPGMKKRSYSSDEDGDYNKRLKTDIGLCLLN